jgi:hypothetical protein
VPAQLVAQDRRHFPVRHDGRTGYVKTKMTRRSCGHARGCVRACPGYLTRHPRLEHGCRGPRNPYEILPPVCTGENARKQSVRLVLPRHLREQKNGDEIGAKPASSGLVPTVDPPVVPPIACTSTNARQPGITSQRGVTYASTSCAFWKAGLQYLVYGTRAEKLLSGRCR